MATTVQDVLNVNLVLVGVGLLNKPEEFNEFRDAVATDVVVAGSGLVIGIPTNTAETGRTLTLNRDRIALDISPSRSVIRRDYPLYGDLDRLAEVIGHAITKTDIKSQEPQAFGYNIELVYDQDSGIPALQYLAKRLFAANLPGNEGWELIGGTSRLLFEGGEARWSVTVDSRFNDEAATKIFLSLNMHRAETRLPRLDEVRASLQEVWTQAHNFAIQLDEGAP